MKASPDTGGAFFADHWKLVAVLWPLVPYHRGSGCCYQLILDTRFSILDEEQTF
jgi:hypothetical protein